MGKDRQVDKKSLKKKRPISFCELCREEGIYTIRSWSNEATSFYENMMSVVSQSALYYIRHHCEMSLEKMRDINIVFENVFSLKNAINKGKRM